MKVQVGFYSTFKCTGPSLCYRVFKGCFLAIKLVSWTFRDFFFEDFPLGMVCVVYMDVV